MLVVGDELYAGARRWWAGHLTNVPPPGPAPVRRRVRARLQTRLASVQTATGDPLLGRVLEGRYRVLERLARGGMSTVYSAMDERLDRAVAVKVMSAALSTDPAFADRFGREARIAARLSHPNAVAVYDQGSDGGHVFLVMELVRGRTLRDVIREQGVLPAAAAVSIMEPVLGALAAAHRAGLVHRDVKPENILIAADGAVKVADFGLARAIESDASSTRTGLMMGTVAYCPPEQIARGQADTRSDVYSAGVVLFELLTGAAPFVGDSAMAVAYQHVNSEVPAPSSRRPDVPAQLDEIVLRATSREPSGRPLDAGAMLAELHDARVDLGLPVVAVPAAQSTRSTEHTQPIAAIDNGPVQHTTVAERGPAEPVRRTGAKPPAPTRPAAAARRRRARRRTAIVVVVILLLGLLTGWGAWYLAVGRYHQIPDVVGQQQSAATNLLVDKGFKVDKDVERQFSETVPAGSVIATDPSTGSHVLGGKLVTLVLSKGPERYKVPTVAGQPADSAAAALGAAFKSTDIKVVRSDKSDDKIPRGNAVGTDPVAGTEIKRDQVVTLFVSSGPPVIAVPDVTGKAKADADATLTKAGFKPAYTQAFSDQVAAGQVISQDPAGASQAVKFSTVNVVVSQGPEWVTIPQIRNGTSTDDAKSALEALGLKVDVHKAFGGLLGQVVGMDPAAGTKVRKGSKVTLTIV